MLKTMDLKKLMNACDDDFFKFLVDIVNSDAPNTGDEVIPGIYIAGLNAEHFISDYIIEEWNSFSTDNDYKSNFGVCDNYKQILKIYPELQESIDRNFVVLMTPIRKSEEPEEDGWRWHKWGPYIGDFEPQCEYIHDEPEIEIVYVYHIFEVR